MARYVPRAWTTGPRASVSAWWMASPSGSRCPPRDERPSPWPGAWMSCQERARSGGLAALFGHLFDGPSGERIQIAIGIVQAADQSFLHAARPELFQMGAHARCGVVRTLEV